MTARRLESLDILRGMDLFLLTILGPLVHLISKTGDYAWEASVMPQLRHVVWEGFTLWDLIMPLFMFMAGASIPFSLDKYRGKGIPGGKVYARIARRFFLLWFLGMIVQGHLLDLDWNTLRFFSNTLQAIAVGYLFSSLFYLWLGPAARLLVSAALLALFWVLMMTVGQGNFCEHGNLCEIVDNAVLGLHRDRAFLSPDGTVTVDPEYTYTWIVSSLNFIVTVMTGTFAGEIVRSAEWSEKRKMLTLLAGGVAMIAAGRLWGLQMPVVKRIWTSSMTLLASGWCMLALLALYFIVDYKKKGRWMSFFKIWGMNSILSYVMHQVIKFTSVSQSLFHGLEQFMSAEWYSFVIGLGCALIEFFILKSCYDRKIYLKV